jgi:uncharacterized protein YjiS (DUF1127 family)
LRDSQHQAALAAHTQDHQAKLASLETAQAKALESMRSRYEDLLLSMTKRNLEDVGKKV